MKYVLRMKRKGPEFNYYGIKKAKPNEDEESNMEKNHRRPLSNFEFMRPKTEKRSKLQGIKNPPVKATYLKKSKVSNLCDTTSSLVADVENVDGEPVDVDTINLEPVNIEPVNIEPIDVEPVKKSKASNLCDTTSSLVVDVENVDGEPVDGEPVDGEPVDGEPVDGETADGDSADGEPADGEPADGDTVDVETIDLEPVNVEPVDVEPVKDVSKCACSSLLTHWMLRMEEKQNILIQKFDELIAIRNEEVNKNSSVSPGEAGKNCTEMLNIEENGATYDQFEIQEICSIGDNDITSQDSVENNIGVEAMASTKENIANFDQMREDVAGLVEKDGFDSIQSIDFGYVCQDAAEENSGAMASTTEDDVANEMINEKINSIALQFPYRKSNDSKVLNDELIESVALFTKMAEYLSGVGGNGPKATLNIFNRIFSKELRREFNWDDKGTTIKSFPNILCLIHAAGRISHGIAYNEKSTNEMIKNSLRNARAKK